LAESCRELSDRTYRRDDLPREAQRFDTDRFEENAKKLGAYCAKHQTIGLITATDALFGK
jgi:hypothetical protein